MRIQRSMTAYARTGQMGDPTGANDPSKDVFGGGGAGGPWKFGILNLKGFGVLPSPTTKKLIGIPDPSVGKGGGSSSGTLIPWWGWALVAAGVGYFAFKG